MRRLIIYDTGVISRLLWALAGRRPDYYAPFLAAHHFVIQQSGRQVVITTAIYFELLPTLRELRRQVGERRYREALRFVLSIPVVPLDRAIASRLISLGTNVHGLQFADASIAATCMELRSKGAELFTLNHKDFARVPGLPLFRPPNHGDLPAD